MVWTRQGCQDCVLMTLFKLTSINKCRMIGTYQTSWETYKNLLINLQVILVLIHPLQDKISRMSCLWHRMGGNNVSKKLNILQSSICSFSYWNPQWLMYVLDSSHLWMTGGFVKSTKLWGDNAIDEKEWLFKHRFTNLNHFTSISKVG